jgi:AraC-like DNA-binding protein
MGEINYNITSLIDFLGLIQGVILGIVLIIGNRKNRPSLFLGLFLITFSTELISVILEDTNLIDLYPTLLFLPTNFTFLSLVLFFLYAKSVMSNLEKRDYWFLSLGVIEFIIFTVLFCFPVSAKINMMEIWDSSLLFVLYELLFLGWFLFFLIKILQLVRKHRLEIENYFSDIQNRKLKWVEWAVYYQLFYFGFIIISIFIFTEKFDNIVYSIISILNVGFIYGVGIYGLRQPRVEMPIEKNSTKVEKEPELEEKITIKTEKIDNLEQLYQHLLHIMQTEKPFKNAELTLTDLAQLTRMPIKKLSHLINLKAEVNFNTFINQYRIEEAKAMLIDAEFNHLNVVGIGYEVGFNSKATFYNVFKKTTNTTPAKFKKTALIKV